jgi:hypothetical protein
MRSGRAKDIRYTRSGSGSNPDQLQRLAEWLIEHEVEEAVRESPLKTI